jgi:hypothetical protein
MGMRKAAVVLLGVLLIAVVGGYVAWRLTKRVVRESVQNLTVPQEKTIDLGALVTQVRELSRLETASMRVMHVSTITQSYKMVPDALAGDQLTFLAAGDVIAGIDLSRLQPKDVWRQGDGTIVMRLPPPQILITRVDNRESRVINRKTGVLRRSDVNLESRVRQHAEQSIRNEAMRKGILLMASQNAEKRLADFLHALGFQKVRFERSVFATPTA